MASATAEQIKNDFRMRIDPAHHKAIKEAGHKLATIEPQTALGKIALNLAAQTSVSVLSVAAISGLVYALREASLPTVTFRGPSPGPGIDNKQLQEAYNTFQTQFATFQGQAGAWIDTQQGSGGASIFSQLVSVPTTFHTINQSVLTDFTVLKAETPGSDAYKQTLANLEALIKAELPNINSLKTSMETLGSNLQNASVTIVTAADNGVLKQLIDAYSSEISSLNQDISNLNDKIDSDNKKIIGLGFAAGAAIVVGIVGIVNFWNPVGWIMMGGGAVGAYFAISEILALKGEIATMKAKIQNDEAWKAEDSTAAAGVSAFSNQVKGFDSMNTAAQKELTTLETLYQTLADDINQAISDLDNGQLDQAEQEWNEIVAAAQVLQDLTAYIWPTSIMLSNPTSFSPTGSDIYAVDMSGKVYQYTRSNNSWSNLPNTSLSCVANGSTVIAIDGAPIDGSTVNPNPSASTYFVKQYNSDTNAWTDISSFPAAAVTTDGTSIFCINQTTDDRQVYKYNGSGTDWTKQAALPGPDAASQIAIAGGNVYALTNNSQKVFGLNAGSWSQVGDFTCASIVANGGKLSLIDANLNLYLYDTSTGGSPVKTGSSASSAAQLSNGDQLVITTDLNLCYINNQQSPSTSTTLVTGGVTGVFVSDTDVAYYTDNQGKAWVSNGSPSSNDWTQLPAYPSS